MNALKTNKFKVGDEVEIVSLQGDRWYRLSRRLQCMDWRNRCGYRG